MLDYYYYANWIPKFLDLTSLTESFKWIVNAFEKEIQRQIIRIEPSDEPHIPSFVIHQLNSELHNKLCYDPINKILGMPNTWNRVFPYPEFSSDVLLAQRAIDEFSLEADNLIESYFAAVIPIAKAYYHFDFDSFKALIMTLDRVSSLDTEFPDTYTLNLFRNWIWDLADLQEGDHYVEKSLLDKGDNAEKLGLFKGLTYSYAGIEGLESDKRLIQCFEIDTEHRHASMDVNGRLLQRDSSMSYEDDGSENPYRRVSEGGCFAKLQDGFWVCAGPAPEHMIKFLNELGLS